MSQIGKAIAVTLTVTSIVWGQSTGARPANETGKTPTADAQWRAKTVDATRKQPLALLDQLLESAGGFTDAEVRIRVQTKIADLLWEHDQPRARELVTAAFHAIAKTELPPIDKEIPPSYVGADSHFPLRSELVRMIAEHDPVLAVKLVETVVDEPPNIDAEFLGSGYGHYSEQSLLYKQIADRIGVSDPVDAARIGRNSIEKGDIELGLRVLGSLPAANADLANDLFAQALAASSRDKERAVSHMSSLAGIVFPRFGEGVILFVSGDRDRLQANPPKPEFVRPFLEFAYEVITDQIRSTKPGDGEGKVYGSQAPPDFTVFRLLVPYFEQYMPDKASILRPRLEEAVRMATASAGERGEIGRARTLLTVQEMLEAAETAESPERRDRIFFEAAVRASRSGDLDQAKQIANKITSSQTRSSVELSIRNMEDQQRSQAIHEAIRRGDFDNAYRLINEQPDLRRRIGELGNLALGLLTKRENARAAQVIAEAQRLIPNTESSFDRMYNQLRLAGIASRLDVDRAFGDLRSAVVTINSAKLAPKWKKIEQGPPGTFVRTDIGIGRLGFAFDAGFAAFGRIDFNRALQAARGIEMKEVSVLAQLAVCRGALNNKQ